MTKENTRPARTTSGTVRVLLPSPGTRKKRRLKRLASICSVLVVGLFILTFLAQNFVIPSGSMENTLLVGDHLVVDRITLAPPAKWMPLVHYREPRRGDIVVFIKPVAEPNRTPTASRDTSSWSSASSACPATISICATAS